MSANGVTFSEHTSDTHLEASGGRCVPPGESQAWDLEAFFAPDGPLEEAARASDAVAARWQSLLTEADRRALIQGFYLAEALAGVAIEQARAQVPTRYHAGLDAQAADEARHIAVFAQWLGGPPTFPVPRPKERQLTLWLVLLLVNELTGFCQFCMLMRLLTSDAEAAQVLVIAQDERVHIRRLLTWLEPLWSTRSALPMGGFVDRFRRDLPGRMCQFFPRAELKPLRDALTAVIDALLQRLPLSSAPVRATRDGTPTEPGTW